MISAYNKLYLNAAQKNLAVMIDFTVNNLGFDLAVFWDMFLKSEYSHKFEKGDYRVLVGMSGLELANNIVGDVICYDRYENENRSKEYWLGYYLAYFQWRSNLSFSKINEYVPIKEILLMYSPYHEMDLSSFFMALKDKINERKSITNLEIIRKRRKLSRNELSQLADIPLRTIEQYEQRRKNINRASADYIISLSRALSCSIEDLLEIE